MSRRLALALFPLAANFGFRSSAIGFVPPFCGHWPAEAVRAHVRKARIGFVPPCGELWLPQFSDWLCFSVLRSLASGGRVGSRPDGSHWLCSPLAANFGFRSSVIGFVSPFCGHWPAEAVWDRVQKARIGFVPPCGELWLPQFSDWLCFSVLWSLASRGRMGSCPEGSHWLCSPLQRTLASAVQRLALFLRFVVTGQQRPYGPVSRRLALALFPLAANFGFRSSVIGFVSPFCGHWPAEAGWARVQKARIGFVPPLQRTLASAVRRLALFLRFVVTGLRKPIGLTPGG